MKLVNYTCESCDKDYEEYFQDTETPPQELEEKCKCGGKLLINNIKRNCHRWNYMDRGGL